MNRKTRRADAKLGQASNKPAPAAVAPPGAALLEAGLAHHRAGRLAEAETCYRRVLEVQPDHADALHLSGVIAHHQKRHDLAVELIGRAIARNGQNPFYLSNLGAALKVQGRLDEAVAAYRRAIGIDPRHAEIHSNLGNALKELDKLDEAVASYRQALTLRPNYAEACSNLGAALREQGKLDEAVSAYQRAIRFNPDLVEALSNLGNVLQEQGKLDEAVASYRRALTLAPNYAEAHSNLLMALHYMTGVSNAGLLDAARAFGKTFDRPSEPTISAKDPTGDRRLRIGYVSGDFRYHPVGYFFSGVLTAHNRDSVEAFCYSNSVIVDALTDRIRGACDHWRTIVGLSDADAATLMRRDGIDILVDLAGHTGMNRLPLFALRPAPVQASWLGYFGTTGLAAMDYVLMDATTAPPGEERWFTEAMVRLPYGRFCYEAPETAPATLDPPCLERGRVTFGSFNKVAKIGPDVVRLWAKVLQAVPGSRLILKWKSLLGEDSSRRRISEAFASFGIPADRLEFRGFSPHLELLAEYGDIDIALDPFPFGGGLTSCEALWMGVPVITLPGDRPASRQTLGFLHQLDLGDLAASSPTDYVARTASLAADPRRLARLRHSLRPRLAASPACNGPLFTVALESAYQEMWSRRRSGRPAVAFDVSPRAAGSTEKPAPTSDDRAT